MIRRATAADVDEIVAIDQSATGGESDRAEQLRSYVASGECLVHVTAGSVTGFAVIRRANFFGRDFIELLVVSPRYRRSGIGRALLRAAVVGAATEQVFTSTNTSNMAMRSLLDDERWSVSGELDGLDEGDPELVFFKARPA
jgi:ribosomal protein S18 acetylase RimI-like enzyme